MAFSPDDIEIKEFVPTLRGYGREEVRAFLRSVAEDVRRLEEQLTDARTNAPSRETGSTATPAGPATGVPILQRGVADLVAVNGLQSAITDLTVAIQVLATRTTRGAEASTVTPAVRIAQFEEATRVAGERAASVRQAVRLAHQGGLGNVGDTPVEWSGLERRHTGRPWAAPVAVEHAETPRDRENSALLRAMIPLVLGTSPSVDPVEDPVSTDVDEPERTNVVSFKRAVS